MTVQPYFFKLLPAMIVLGISVTTFPVQGNAWTREWPYDQHTSYEYVYEKPLDLNGRRYFYQDGYYYVRKGKEFYRVDPPVGDYVRRLPRDYREVEIDGVTYYVSGQTYYTHTRRGYQVVYPPVQAVAALPPVYTAQQPSNSLSVQVAVAGGGYKTVTFQRSGDGYVGPQGEFYAQMPPSSQIEAMYGK